MELLLESSISAQITGTWRRPGQQEQMKKDKPHSIPSSASPNSHQEGWLLVITVSNDHNEWKFHGLLATCQLPSAYKEKLIGQSCSHPVNCFWGFSKYPSKICRVDSYMCHLRNVEKLLDWENTAVVLDWRSKSYFIVQTWANHLPFLVLHSKLSSFGLIMDNCKISVDYNNKE